MMAYWRTVLMLVNNGTGEQIKDPIPEVLSQASALLLEANTAVNTTGGKRRKAGVSIRPVKDDRETLIGAVMKIKEKPE